jgi:uncharacterized integral membrane protein (TIGR00698 family)
MLLGLLICCLSALAATWLATLQHIIGAPLLGLFIGILLGNLLPGSLWGRAGKGVAFSSKRILRVGVILAGGTLNFSAVVQAGLGALPMVIGGICIAFLTAWLVGKVLGVPSKTRLLVGGGTSICGGTAIATLSAVIDAESDETAYAMTSIFLFDILAALMWPYVAVWVGFTPSQFGLLGGIAINDVSSVTAAGDTFNALMGAAAYNEAGMSGGDLAMIIKLTRVAMLVVVTLVMTIGYEIQQQKQNGQTAAGPKAVAGNILKAFPFYVLGFLALAVVNTLVNFKSIAVGGTTLGGLMTPAYKYLFTVALVGVGCKIKLRDLFTKGVRPVILGGLTWVAVSAATLIYAAVLG